MKSHDISIEVFSNCVSSMSRTRCRSPWMTWIFIADVSRCIGHLPFCGELSVGYVFLLSSPSVFSANRVHISRRISPGWKHFIARLLRPSRYSDRIQNPSVSTTTLYRESPALLKSKRCLGNRRSPALRCFLCHLENTRTTELLQYVLGTAKLPFLLTSKVFKVRRSMGTVVYMTVTP